MFGKVFVDCDFFNGLQARYLGECDTQVLHEKQHCARGSGLRQGRQGRDGELRGGVCHEKFDKTWRELARCSIVGRGRQLSWTSWRRRFLCTETGPLCLI